MSTPETSVVTEGGGLVSPTPEEPFLCSACQGSTDPQYQTYNLIVSGVVMMLIGMVGLCGNCLVVRVYYSRTQRVHSSSIYLAALAVSDFFLILTALFLFVLEAWRHHDKPWIAWLYVSGTPYIFPLAAVFQTSSVYICVAAAVDCFITVILTSLKDFCCTPFRAKVTVLLIMAFCFLYNIPHAFELTKVECWDTATNATSSQICPTKLRENAIYYTIYYTYMYTTFLAIGPLCLLIVINVCIVFSVIMKNKQRPPHVEPEESDLTSLILVVFFFIFCNSTALFVNFLETIMTATQGSTPEGASNVFVYLVDFSNLLIVLNGTMNFFCYLSFGASFRRTLIEILFHPRQKLKLRVDESSSETLPISWKAEATRLDGASLL